MASDEAEEKALAGPHLQTTALKRFATVVLLMFLAYLAGFVPAWFSERGYELEISDLQRQTRLNSIRASIAEAALNANRGDFEEARRNSSDFFTDLRAEIDREDPLIDPSSRGKIEDILSQRDDVITNLARGNKDTANVLSAWYFTTKDLLRGR